MERIDSGEHRLKIDAAHSQEAFPDVGAMWRGLDTQNLPNALTCDVEDYFQVSAFEHLVPKHDWSNWPCRIESNTDRILELYDLAGVKGTFFTLGWIADNYPNVVRRIAGEGHEIASHGWQHERVWSQTAGQFRDDVSRTRQVLQDLSGQPVLGFRAASWSFDRRTHWAYDVLASCGYQYSSSIYPVSHDHYGIPDAPLQPFFDAGSNLLEIPASSFPLAGRNIPSAGGGYFRLLPYFVSQWLIRNVRERNEVPAVFYYHPWEIDPEQPRMSGIGFKTRFRHYVNLGRFENRLRRLISSGRWDRMDTIYLGSGHQN